MLIAGIFFILILIFAIVKLIILQKGKKRINKSSNENLLKSSPKQEKKIEIKKIKYGYKYWNEVINGNETVGINKSEVKSKILLNNWDYISKYYYVIREEVKAMRNSSNFSEEQIVYDLSFNQKLTKELYKINLELIKNKITAFLINILENSGKLRKPEMEIPLKAISLIYFLYDNSSFYIRAEPSRVFHNEKYSTYMSDFELKHKLDIDISGIETAIFDELNIIVGDYYDEYSDYTYDLFSKMMFECWEKAKQKTGSNLLGSLDYGSGGIDYDLDIKESIDGFNITEHYKKRGIVIERDLEN